MLFIKEILIICLIYYWFFAIVAAADTSIKLRIRPCTKGRELDAKSKVEEISLSPCPGTGSCQLYRGHNATITVKFTPSINTGCQLKSKFSWLSKIDMDFGRISSNACDYMNCPLEMNKEAVFSATFAVSKMWPTGPYPLKLRVWENEGRKRMIFCQLIKVYLTSQPVVDSNMLT